MLNLKMVAGAHQEQVSSIAHAAATATEYIAKIRVPFTGYLKKVIFVPDAAVTGQDTNTTNLNVVNLGTGAGTTELYNYDLTNGNNVAVTGYEFGSTKTAVTEGGFIGLQAEKVSTGLAIPAGTFICEFWGG